MDPTRRDVVAIAAGLALLAGQAYAEPIPASGAEPGEPLQVRTPDGLTLSGRSYGDPAHPEILLVHGLNQSRLSWERQVGSPLAERFRIVAFDLRGHGDSDKPDDVSAYADAGRWAGDLHAVIGTAFRRRPTVVGWSIGGRFVGDYLARYGAAGIAGLNLVNAVTHPSTETLSKAALGFNAPRASRDLLVRTRAYEDFLAACFATQPSPAAFRRMLVFNGMVPRAVQEGVLHLDNSRLDAAFASVPRLLVTQGGKDALQLPAMAQRVLALNPAAALSRYPDAGHAVFYEDPERFNAELAAFVAG